MRWEDERYVRLYTRDTVDWHFLSLEAQGLMGLLMRKVDRAGIMDLGRHGKRGVAVALGHSARWETIGPALEELIADGCVTVDGDRLVIRNFIEAQETPQSDVARKRAQREKDRDTAVTKRDQMSRSVTPSHAESRGVTPNQPNQPSEPAEPIKEKKVSSKDHEAALELLADEAFAYWAQKFALNGKTKFTDDRKRKVMARLREGYSLERIKRGVDGCHGSDWHHEAGQIDLELICRTASKLEGFERKAGAGPPKRTGQARAEQFEDQHSHVGEYPENAIG